MSWGLDGGGGAVSGRRLVGSQKAPPGIYAGRCRVDAGEARVRDVDGVGVGGDSYVGGVVVVVRVVFFLWCW